MSNSYDANAAAYLVAVENKVFQRPSPEAEILVYIAQQIQAQKYWHGYAGEVRVPWRLMEATTPARLDRALEDAGSAFRMRVECNEQTRYSSPHGERFTATIDAPVGFGLR
jgi:hypothetical protein